MSTRRHTEIYSVYGTTLRSNVPLDTRLADATASEYDVVVRVGSGPSTAEYSWMPLGDDSRDDFMQVSRTHLGHALLVRGIGTFFAYGTTVAAWVAAAVDEDTLRHLLLNQVFPRLLGERGEVVLHAGAVVRRDGALAILGAGGSGKSSLVTALARNGLLVLTDDCLVLRQRNGVWLAYASHEEIRLWGSAAKSILGHDADTLPIAFYTSKRRLARGSAVFATDPAPMSLVVVIDGGATGGTLTAVRMTPRDSLLVLLRSMFRFTPPDRNGLEACLERYRRLVEDCPFFAVSYPREYERLEEVAAWLTHPGEHTP